MVCCIKLLLSLLPLTRLIINCSIIQERDLERLRRQWLAALTKRQQYLDEHLQSLVSKTGNVIPAAALSCSGSVQRQTF